MMYHISTMAAPTTTSTMTKEDVASSLTASRFASSYHDCWILMTMTTVKMMRKAIKKIFVIFRMKISSMDYHPPPSRDAAQLTSRNRIPSGSFKEKTNNEWISVKNKEMIWIFLEKIEKIYQHQMIHFTIRSKA